MIGRIQLSLRRTVIALLCICCLVPAPAAALELADESITEPPVASQAVISEIGPSVLSAPNKVAKSEEIETDPEIPPAPIETAAGVVVSRVLTGTTAAANQEIIELFNSTAQDIDITNWCVEYYSSSLTERKTCFSPTAVGYHVMLPAQSYVVLASDAATNIPPGLARDGTIAANGLAEARGKVIFRDANGTHIDGVAWSDGKKGNEVDSVEGVIADAPARGQELARIVADGIYKDTHDNKQDFTVDVPRQKYTVGAINEVLDYCTNIPGMQYQLPADMTRDELDGACHDMPLVPPPTVTCEGIIIAEIAANVSVQFIELYNPTDQPIPLAGCILKTNRSDAAYKLPEQNLASGRHYVVSIKDSGLTLTKTTTGTVYLISPDGQIEYDGVAYAYLKENTAWALVDGEWKQTYMLTPEMENVYLQYMPCSDGYERNTETGRCNKIVLGSGVLADCGVGRERNPDTGRCRTAPVSSQLAPCSPGQVRNPETNRCRSATLASATLTPCKAGQERNPATNRCRSVASATSTLKPCAAGQERNPETNRCRKVAGSVLGEAAFPVESVKDTGTAFAAWWALGGVIVLGIGYAGWEYRHELAAIIRRVIPRGKS